MTSMQFFISLIPVALVSGYFQRFTRATLLLGKSLSDTDSPRGFQDAITPPWQTKCTLICFLLSITGIAFGFYQFGWMHGGLAIIFLFIGTGIFASLMPRPDSFHFKIMIVRSMMNRYANYVKANDQMRASAMKQLIDKYFFKNKDFL
jgi:hypothetical protein